VRYADDCNIYVRSEKAGRRVMASLTRFIERRLKLQINTEKSAVARPWQRSFLGFTVRNDPEFRRGIADKAKARFKHRVRTCGDGPATSPSASRTSCHRWMAGSGGAFAASPGSNGRRAATATANSAASLSPSSRPVRPSSARRDRGG